MDSDDSDFEDIEQYFDPKYWKELSNCEKKRYLSMKRNYEVLQLTGMNPPRPQFMTTKEPEKETFDLSKQAKKIFKKYKFKVKTVLEDNSRGRHVGACEKSKKSKSESLRKPKRHIVPIKQIVLIESSKISQPETVEKPDEPTPTPPKQPGTYCSNDGDFCLDDVIDSEAPAKTRYFKPNTPKERYTENYTYDMDVFTLVSDVCDIMNVENNLISNPPRKVLPLTHADNYASLNLPSFFTLCLSGIPPCKRFGVWTDKALSKGVVFGPYHGAVIEKFWHDTYKVFAWKVYAKSKNSQEVKDSNPSACNWLHCVNCAESHEHQNLIAFEHKRKLYYRICKDVKPYTELLVWYQNNYKKEVGIDIANKTEPKKSVSYECELCQCVFKRRLRSKQQIKTGQKIVCPHCLSPESGMWNSHP